jgi:hypothetical protein
MRLWRRHRADSRRAVSPDTAALAGSLAALIEIVEQGVRAQPNAEETIAECCRAGEVPRDVARRGGRVISEYARLHEEATEHSAGPGSLQNRVAELLLYHATTVEGCLKLAFSRFWGPQAQRDGHTHSGLGEPARTLRESAAALRMWLNDLESDGRR